MTPTEMWVGWVLWGIPLLSVIVVPEGPRR